MFKHDTVCQIVVKVYQLCQIYGKCSKDMPSTNRVSRENDISISAILKAVNAPTVLEVVTITLWTWIVNVDVTEEHSSLHVAENRKKNGSWVDYMWSLPSRK